MTPKEFQTWFAAPGVATIELAETIDLRGIALRGSGKTVKGGMLKRARILSTDCSFVGVAFDMAPLEGEQWYAAIACNIDGSKRLSFTGCKFGGGSLGMGMGMRAIDVEDITVSDCEFKDGYQGPAFTRAKRVTVEDCDCHHLGENGITGAGVDGFTIRRNIIRDISAFGTAHPDAIQTWTHENKGILYPMLNVLIEDNIILQGNGTGMQGVFHRSRAAVPATSSVESTMARGFIVRRNLLYGWAQWHGITIYEGAEGVVVEDNLVLSPLDSVAQYRIDLKGCTAPIVRRNVANAYLNTPAGVFTKAISRLIPDLAKRALATARGLRLQEGGVELMVATATAIF